VIETERLILRGWRDSDREPFAAMGRDPRVMEHLGPLATRAETDVAVDRQNALLARDGHCFWAIERRADGAFIGFCGIKPGPEGTPIADRPEIGWRLAHAYWGHGYAREAAAASLAWGWANLPDECVWAITTPTNTRSWGLMERLGMARRNDMDFDHPAVPDDSPLKPHITYEARRPA
jgi:RimJ/RimL family protein N-acetyltransferase